MAPVVMQVVEERRFFLRIGLFTVAAGVVYWFLSYEAAGSLMLVLVGIATVVLVSLLRPFSDESGTRSGPLGIARDLLTFEDRSADSSPIELAEPAFPSLSLQPVMLSMGAGALAVGMVFGAWLWIPGALLFAGAAWRWLTELD